MISNSWDEAMRAQENERRRAEYESLVRDQQDVNGQMDELMERTRREQARQQLDLNNVMASAIKRSGGGALPDVLRGFINRRYGWDGVSTGVLQGSGFQDDGSYIFRLGNGTDQQGRVATQNVSFGRPQLFKMMQTNRSAFDDGDRTAMRDALLRSGMTEKEVASMEFDPFPGAVGRTIRKDEEAADMNLTNERMRSFLKSHRASDPDHIRNQMSGGAGGRQVGRGATFKGPERPLGRFSPASISYDGDGGMSTIQHDRETGEVIERGYGTRDPNYKGRWKQISVGPSEDGKTQVRRYENDKTGEVVSVRDGETPPWQSGGQPGERERIARMNNDARMSLQKTKGEQNENIARINAESARYKADAMRQIQEIRARAGEEAGRKLRGSDIKAIADIIGNPMIDDETRNAAKDALSGLLDGKAAQPAAASASGKAGVGGGEEQKGGGKEKTITSRKQARGKDGKMYERIVYSDGSTTINEVQ